MRERVLALGASVILGVLAAPAGSTAAEGLELSLSGPTAATAGEPESYGGRLTLLGHGLPRQAVELLVDGNTAATATTDLDGRYETSLTFRTLGTHRVQAIAHRDTPLETRSPVLFVEVGPPPDLLTIQIVGYAVERLPGSVQVRVHVSGTLTVGGSPLGGASVPGAVEIETPQPCWPDPGTYCAQVVTRQSAAFTATTDPDGIYATTVGPFTYQAASPLPSPECMPATVEARAEYDAGTRILIAIVAESTTLCE